jgi:uncharacterized membrane protein (TIGR02234 family)
VNEPAEGPNGGRARPNPGLGRLGLRRFGSRRLAVVVALVGAGIVVLAAGRAWARTTIVGLPGPDLVVADGRSVVPGAPALALVAVAGAVVLATSGHVVRMIVAGLLTLAGAGVAALSVAAVSDPTATLGPAVARATGTVGAASGFVGHLTVWPAVSGAGGALIAAGGAVALVLSRRWPGPLRRFEPRAGSATRPVRDRVDAWDRLSAGEDPTDESTG